MSFNRYLKRVSGGLDMKERMAILAQELSQLEAEKASIEDGNQEINRRLALLDEVEGWNLLTDPDDAADDAVTNQMEFASEESIEWVRTDSGILSV